MLHLILRYYSSFAVVPISSFKAKDSVQNHMYSFVKSRCSLPPSGNSSDFSWLLWFWHFWGLQARYLVECSTFEFVWCFLVIRFKLCILGRNITEVLLSSSRCILSGDTWFQFAQLLVMLAWYLPGLSTILFFPLFSQ